MLWDVAMTIADTPRGAGNCHFLDDAPFGLCIVIDATIRYINTMFAAAADKQARELVNRPLTDLFDADPDFAAALAAADSPASARIRGSADRLLPVTARKTVMGGETAYVLYLDETKNHDMHGAEQKHTQRETILKLYRDLARARREIRKAGSIKDEFIAHMSHEMRTPLNGIIGVTSLLQQTELSTEQIWYVDMINQSSESLLNLVSEVLDYARLEAGATQAEAVAFCLHDAVFGALGGIAAEAYRKGLEMSCAIDPAIPETLVGDHAHLKRIISNLAQNAVKFTETGDIAIAATIAEQEKSRLTLHFSVADTGKGISNDKLTAIFELFSQEDSTISSRYGGTGLGLAICKKLLELHKGRIWVESKLQKGSVFHFIMPFGLSETFEPSQPSQTAKARECLLIYQKESKNAPVITRTLQAWGWRCKRSHNSMAAHAIGSRFAAVIYDYVAADDIIPDAFAEIRAKLDNKIILLCSPVRYATLAEDTRFKGIYLLPKPVRLNDLRRIIDSEHIVPETSGIEAQRRPCAETPLENVHEQTRLLVVEDNEINQVFLQRALTQNGYRIDLANNGLEACELARKEQYGLILMDVQMPAMDGLEATRHIRKMERKIGWRPVIVALSAGTNPKEKEACIEAGMDAFLPKPISTPQLLEKVSEHLGGNDNTGGRAVPAPAAPAPGATVAYEQALQALDNDKDLLQELLAIVVGRWETLQQSALDAYKKGDADTLGRALHTIKGSVNAFAAEQFIHHISKLIEICRAGRLPAHEKIVSLLDKQKQHLEGLQDFVDA